MPGVCRVKPQVLCPCGRQPCPLAYRHSAGTKAFSSCSIRDFQRFLATGEGQCLLNRPTMDVSYKAPVCGNKVVEPGEACDCGSAEVSCEPRYSRKEPRPVPPGGELSKEGCEPHASSGGCRQMLLRGSPSSLLSSCTRRRGVSPPDCLCWCLQECRRDLCCTVGCKRRKGVQCLSGPCCWKCKVSCAAAVGTLRNSLCVGRACVMGLGGDKRLHFQLQVLAAVL